MGTATADGSDMVTVVGTRVALAKADPDGPCPAAYLQLGESLIGWFEGVSVIALIDAGKAYELVIT